MEMKSVKVSRTEDIARVELNRASKRNALDYDMCIALRTAFVDLDADPNVGAVVLSGLGTCFCAGADLKERDGRDTSWIRSRRLAAYSAYWAIQQCRHPVIAAVHGAVIGSGGEMALCCDFIIAAEGTTFRFPEAHRGSVGATQRLQRAVGKRRAKEMLFTNRIVAVEEAREIGLVARIVDLERATAVALEVAREICGAPRMALELTKQAIDLGAGVDLATGLHLEMSAVEQCLSVGSWISTIE